MKTTRTHRNLIDKFRLSQRSLPIRREYIYVNTQYRWHHMTFLSKSHQEKEQEKGRSAGDEGKIEKKLSEVNTRAVYREYNKLIGEFKMGVIGL
jgi:hypothetical protein